MGYSVLTLPSELAMTAEILPFARKIASSNGFHTFDEILEYKIQEPNWVSQDQSACTYGSLAAAAELQAWFAWFGVSVDVVGPPHSLLEG